eukprot:s641_g25.t1
MSLRITSAMSGEDVAELEAEVVESWDRIRMLGPMRLGAIGPARDLKRFLVPKTNFTIFQQRLFREDQSECLDDDLLEKEPRRPLQLVLLAYPPADAAEDKKLFTACEQDQPEDLSLSENLGKISKFDGHLEVVRVLLERQALPDQVDDDGLTPLHQAARSGHADIARLLLMAGAARDPLTVRGAAPLHWAAAYGHEVVKCLVEAGALIDQARGDDRRSPLHMAVQHGQLEVVRFLLQVGADKNRATLVEGATPLHWAAVHGHVQMAKLLVEARAELDKKTKGGFSAMHLAVRTGNMALMRLLERPGPTGPNRKVQEEEEKRRRLRPEAEDPSMGRSASGSQMEGLHLEARPSATQVAGYPVVQPPAGAGQPRCPGASVSGSTTPTDGGEGVPFTLLSRLRNNPVLQVQDSRIMRLIGKRSVLKSNGEIQSVRAKPNLGLGTSRQSPAEDLQGTSVDEPEKKARIPMQISIFHGISIAFLTMEAAAMAFLAPLASPVAPAAPAPAISAVSAASGLRHGASQSSRSSLAAPCGAAAVLGVARRRRVRRRFFNLFGPEEVIDPEDPGRVGVCKEYQSMPGTMVAAEESEFGWAVVSRHDASEQDGSSNTAVRVHAEKAVSAEEAQALQVLMKRYWIGEASGEVTQEWRELRLAKQSSASLPGASEGTGQSVVKAWRAPRAGGLRWQRSF